MGLDLFLALGFSVTDSSGTCVLQIVSSWPDRYPQLFTGLGRMSAFVHQPTVDSSVRLVIQPLRRIPLALRDEVETELGRLVEEDVIEPVDASPWVSNLVVARKKGGGLRLCVNLSDVNKAIIPDKYPLPTAEELTSHFHGSTVFSKMDLRNGYLQVPLAPASMDLTAFVTHVGVFRFKRMAFGLSSAPSCFQKIMSLILAGIPGVSIYLDDVVVHAPTMTLHDARLAQVFQRFEQHGVKLNAGKCVFGVTEVEFLGFRLSQAGIAPIMSHTEAILSLPDPQSPAQLSSFLGMAAYYLRFMPHFSDSTAPLRGLLRKDARWDWTPACHEAVRVIKQQLTSPPTLTHFSQMAPTLVTCDASGLALGAVLSQIHEGVERPVAFASRALTPAEQKYSVGEREALACLWACERWHVYLYGRAFTIRTDHQALTALLATQGSGHKPMRLLRWADRLNQYNFRLEFMPGRANTVADLLSRAVSVTKEAGEVTRNTENDDDLVHILHGPLSSVVTLTELQKASADDETFATLRIYIQDGWPAKVDDNLLPYYRFRNELSCWGTVCLARGHRAVVPETLRSRVLHMAHEGHLGVVKVKQRCRDTVWWPHIDLDVEELVRNCACCLLSGKTGQPATAPLNPAPWPSSPWEHIQIDLCGELHGAPAHARYLLVVHDLHSKWPEVFQLSSVTTHTIIGRLEELFGRWGLPSVVTTDNGPQFISAEFTEFLKQRSIKHIRTAAYHPESNGGVERLNKTLKNGIRACMEEGNVFSEALNQTLLSIRASKHSTTGVSPALLMIGRELKQPLDCLRAQPVPPHGTQGLQKVRARVISSQARMKRQFDDTHRVQTPSLAVGDWVRIKRANRQHKLQSYWSDPLRVTQKLGSVTYRLENGTRWHSNRLHKVPAPTTPMDNTYVISRSNLGLAGWAGDQPASGRCATQA
uniref:Gypsy retrotransposon integrase-like protein 1 n=2 Tax=Oryzias latipes TaxID=8090 RepID=A0A3B3IH14_ORYLA